MNNALAIPRLLNLQNTLKLTFGLVPIAAGADKFLNLLTRWDQYLAPDMVELLPISAPAFMMIVGVIEIIAGVLVLTRTRIGAYIVAAWLFCIALTLVVGLRYLDVAVRDIVMGICALVLARSTEVLAPAGQNAGMGQATQR